jgi:toxin ParE1/3/4
MPSYFAEQKVWESRASLATGEGRGQVEVDLDEIWLYVATETSSMDAATRLIDSIADCFFLLSSFPYAGRARDDFGIGAISFAAGDYLIVYCVEDQDVLILRVIHGKRDMEELFGR